MLLKRPATPAVAAAARANGAKTRGPVTGRGKFHSSGNGLIHGRYAKVHTLSDDRWPWPGNSDFATGSLEAITNKRPALSGSRVPDKTVA